MRRRALTAASFLAATLVAGPEGAMLAPPPVPVSAERCLGTLAALNANASVPLAEYQQNNSRWWPHYLATFHPTQGPELFRRRTQALAPGDVVVDVGSGKGTAMMQLAGAKAGVKTVAINAQNPKDFFDHVDGLGAAVRRRREHALTYDRSGPEGAMVGLVDGVSQRDLLAIAAACRFPAPRWLTEPFGPGKEADLATVARDLDALSKQFREWRRSASVEFAVGSALEQLKGRENTADVLVDVYGAFFYGEDRLALLEAYYATLKPGGVAFVCLGRTEEYGGDEVHRNEGGPPVTLPSYLVGKYDGIFDVYQSPGGRWFLVMEKPVDGPEKLALPLKAKRNGAYQDDGAGNVVPQLRLDEK